MTNQRRHLQEAHEKFTVSLFLDNFNHYYHTDFKVIEEPNPPEAIIQSKRSTRWVEVTTAYMSKEFAIDINSYATQGETHKPSREGLIVGPDAQFAGQFVDAVKKSSKNQLTSHAGKNMVKVISSCQSSIHYSERIH